MCLTTFCTQRQVQRRSGPVAGQAATVQTLLLYGMPAGLFVSGFFFPLPAPREHRPPGDSAGPDQRRSCPTAT